jgi:hypothetical protein
MANCDLFVILKNCQFEKNGFQNRNMAFDKWLTKPVKGGKELIIDKEYADGQSLVDVNMRWIYAIASTLSIDINKIIEDYPTDKKGTDRLIDICHECMADEYLANSKAPEKYLDVKKMEEQGIKFIPLDCKYNKNILEMFAEFGIEGTKKLLCKP